MYSSASTHRSSSSQLARVYRQFFAAFLLPAVLFLGACVSEPSAITGKKQSFGYSWQEELKLGAEADKEITQEMGLYESPQVQSYVESIGRRVLQASDFREPTTAEIYRNTNFTFRVMDSPVVNAFALPGGFVYVTRGLLAHVQNEAQLAVVLGHEIAHIGARHSSQQARRAQIGQIGLIAGAILGQQVLGDRVGDMGSLMNMGGQALEMFMMRYSREAEHESDSLGVGYAQRAGYAAAESAKFFQSLQRLSAAEGKAIPTWQSTHPDPGDRANRVVQLARSAPQVAGAAPVVGEEEFLRRIEGIVVGDDPREGFAQQGIFYHPTLRFQFPVASGWKLNNQKAAVVMADPNGGALLGLRLAPEPRARDAATAFAQNAKVQVTGSSDTVINGLPATVIVGQGTTEQGTIGVWNAFIELEGRVYSLMGLAPAQNFTQVRPTFEAVTGGFSALRNPNLVNVQPARLKLVRADRAAPLASFVPTSLPLNVTAAEVAIMNQLELNDPVPVGRLLKVPDNTGATPPPANIPVPSTTAQQPAPAPAYPGAAYPPANPYPPQAPAASYPQSPVYPQPGAPQTGYPTYPAPGYPATPPPATQQPPVWPR